MTVLCSGQDARHDDRGRVTVDGCDRLATERIRSASGQEALLCYTHSAYALGAGALSRAALFDLHEFRVVTCAEKSHPRRKTAWGPSATCWCGATTSALERRA